MSCVTRLTYLRGTTSQRLNFVPKAGEPVYDTSLSQLFIGDGSTSGGNPLTGENLLSIPARNETGTLIPKGAAVYVSGATGNRVTLELADNNADSTADGTIGLTLGDIADNSDGTVLIDGLLTGLDTSSFSDGDLLYLGESGQVTNTIPLSPKHEIFLGYCLASSPSSGEIFVKVQSFGELSDNHDVFTNGKLDKYVLSYEASTELWKAKPLDSTYISDINAFELISKNIKSWNVTINKVSGDISNIVYTDGTSTITKTFNYISGDLSSLTLSGDTPSGIDLTKTFNYNSGDIVGWSYS